MKVHYEIEKKVIFAPEACALWPIEDPLARATLYAPASQCFLLLLQSAGDILSQKFLFAEVWEKNGLYVNANTLYQNIAVLRKTLKSMGIKEEIIKTVPRQGLKFTGQSTLVQYEEQSKGPTVQQAQINVQETAPDENEMPAQAVNGKEAIEIDAYRFTAWLKKRIWLIPAAIIACSLFLVLYSFMLERNQTERFFNEYSYIRDIKGCKIYSTTQNSDVNHTFFSTLTRLTGLTCQKNDSVWLTLNHQFRVNSAIKCNGDISAPKAQCSTWILPEIDNE